MQRAEPAGRGDEWNDPWMRSKSPGREKQRAGRRDRRSYSSHSSYSSSSSTSHSDSSSNTSRSPTPGNRRRRFNSGGGGGVGQSGAPGPQAKSPAPTQRRHAKRSPSPPKRRGYSPGKSRIIQINYMSKFVPYVIITNTKPMNLQSMDHAEFPLKPAPTTMVVGNVFEPKQEFRNHVIVSSTNKRSPLGKTYVFCVQQIL